MMLSPISIGVSLLALYLAYRVYMRLTRMTRLHRYFSGKHVWVVGASQGLGAALSLLLHDLGADLTITSRSEERLAKVSAQCTGGGMVNTHVLDVSGFAVDLATAWRQVNTARSVDVLIYNAGINHSGQHFNTLQPEKIDSVIDTNLRGAAHLLRAALGSGPGAEGTTEGTGGSSAGSSGAASAVCLVSSLAAYRGVPGASVYGATKAALSAMATSVNIEQRAARTRTKTRVTAVHPGFINTPAIRGLDHPKPLLMTEHQAALLVLDAVACGDSHYGFPWLMEHVVARFQLALPTPLYEYLMVFA